MTVYSYQHGAEDIQPQEQAPQGVRINADAGRSTSVTIRNGETFVEQNSARRVSSLEINPHHGDGSVFATAKSMYGMSVPEIKADTLLTIQGVQATAKFWEKEGVIHRAADGSYAEGSGQPEEVPEEAPQEDTSDQLTMTDEAGASVNRALEGVGDQHLEGLTATGIAIATGELDRSVIERQLVNVSGASPEEAAARVTTMETAYQHQADSAITERCGVAVEDLADFWAWAKESHKGALREAVQKQVYSSDMSGYRALASRYLSDMPPTVEAVKAGGYETRNEGNKAEVFMEGRWLTIATAARLGML